MIEAVIFDLDGVICSTDGYHFQAWRTLADSLNIPFSRSDNERLRGVSRMESLDILLEKSKRCFIQKEKEKLAEKKNILYRQLLETMTPSDLTDSVKSTLQALRAGGLKLAIGSSSKNAPMILERLGLNNFFDAVCDGNCISHSKPDPEVFCKAADMLGFRAESCLVVEDAASGVQAGHRGHFLVACVGSAAKSRLGKWNLASIDELLDIVSL